MTYKYYLFRKKELIATLEGLFPPEEPEVMLNDTLLIQYAEQASREIVPNPKWTVHRRKQGLDGSPAWFPLPKEAIEEFRTLLLLQQ